MFSLSTILRLCFRDRWHITQRTLLDSRLGKQINFYYCFCMPALFSRDWQFHHTTTQHRDDGGGGRHESGWRTKRRLISSVALWLSLSPLFTLTSLFMFPCAASVLWYYQHSVFCLFYILFLVFGCRVHNAVQLGLKKRCGLLLLTLLSQFFYSSTDMKGMLYRAYATQ